MQSCLMLKVTEPTSRSLTCLPTAGRWRDLGREGWQPRGSALRTLFQTTAFTWQLSIIPPNADTRGSQSKGHPHRARFPHFPERKSVRDSLLRHSHQGRAAFRSGRLSVCCRVRAAHSPELDAGLCGHLSSLISFRSPSAEPRRWGVSRGACIALSWPSSRRLSERGGCPRSTR